jgi:large subunit ribosomal protein L4
MTRTVDVLDAQGAPAGTAELPAAVFDVVTNVPLIHQVVVAQLAAARQGTHSTKTRGEVRGGGRKPYRQKGTGRARQGSTRAPQFVGGGVVHGPKPRDYSQRTPKKMKAAALLGALSDRARHERIHVVTAFIDGGVPATKAARVLVEKITERARVLVVALRSEEASRLSVRNLPQVHLLPPDQLNTYDVMVSDDVIFTEAALAEFLASSKSGLHRAARGAAVADPAGSADGIGQPAKEAGESQETKTAAGETEPAGEGEADGGVEAPAKDAKKAKKAKEAKTTGGEAEPAAEGGADAEVEETAKEADAEPELAEEPAAAEPDKAAGKSGRAAKGAAAKPAKAAGAKPAKAAKAAGAAKPAKTAKEEAA